MTILAKAADYCGIVNYVYFAGYIRSVVVIIISSISF